MLLSLPSRLEFCFLCHETRDLSIVAPSSVSVVSLGWPVWSVVIGLGEAIFQRFLGQAHALLSPGLKCLTRCIPEVPSAEKAPETSSESLRAPPGPPASGARATRSRGEV